MLIRIIQCREVEFQNTDELNLKLGELGVTYKWTMKVSAVEVWCLISKYQINIKPFSDILSVDPRPRGLCLIGVVSVPIICPEIYIISIICINCLVIWSPSKLAFYSWEFIELCKRSGIFKIITSHLDTFSFFSSSVKKSKIQFPVIYIVKRWIPL